MLEKSRQKVKKPWKGKKRIAFKYLKKGLSFDNYKWAISINVGDWVGTCDGCNRQIKEIIYNWRQIGTRTKFLLEIDFIDNNGHLHVFPGGGCVFPKESISDIESYYKKWILEIDRRNFDWDDGSFKNSLLKMQKAFDESKPIVDKNGQFLSEFERVLKCFKT